MGIPTPEELRALLRYEPETGRLFWKERPHTGQTGYAERARKTFNAQFAGREAFTATSYGYRTGAIYSRNYKAHRVAWAIFYGEWPTGEIDHINGARKDNRIANLRDISQADNKRNMARSSRNKSGATGVWWSDQHRNWRAMIGRRHIGTYANFSDALSARKSAERDLGFHANHGRPQ